VHHVLHAALDGDSATSTILAVLAGLSAFASHIVFSGPRDHAFAASAAERNHEVSYLHPAARAVLRHARPPDAAHRGPNRTAPGSHDRPQARESVADRPGGPGAAPRDQHDRGR